MRHPIFANRRRSGADDFWFAPFLAGNEMSGGALRALAGDVSVAFN
jgi:hypothetical protein